MVPRNAKDTLSSIKGTLSNIKVPELKNPLSETLTAIQDIQKQLLDIQERLSLLEEAPIPASKKSPSLNDEVVEWTLRMISESSEEGLSDEEEWKQLKCIMAKQFNPRGDIHVELKWVTKDQRPGILRKTHIFDSFSMKKLPMLRCSARILASPYQVNAMLSDASRIGEYNAFVPAGDDGHHDVEDLSPDTKVVWSCCPRILTLAPRDFVAAVHFRYLPDGSQVVVSYAVDHPDAPAISGYTRGLSLLTGCRVSPVLGDPHASQVDMVLYADPARGNLPEWAVKSMVNVLAPLEPFKFFHGVDQAAQRTIAPPQNHLLSPPHGPAPVPVRHPMDENDHPPQEAPTGVKQLEKRLPGGMSNLGFAAFWPLTQEDHTAPPPSSDCALLPVDEESNMEPTKEE